MTPFADWPVRPRAKRGESLAGYVYRLHSDNGHSLIFNRSAYQLLKACYCDGRPTSDLDEGDIMSGLRAAFDDDMDFVAWRLAFDLFWRNLSLEMIADQPRRTGLQACPCCLRELRFHLRFWELPWVHACPVHGCTLMTHCKRCRQALNWHAMNVDWEHKCGHSLLEETPVAAASFERGIADWLSRAVDAPPCGPAPQGNRLHCRIPMTLQMQYRRLVEFKMARQVIIDQLLPIFAGATSPESAAATSRRGPHLWELRLALAGPTALRRDLTRWAHRYLRQLGGNTAHQPVLLRLPHAQTEALEKLTEQYRALREPLWSIVSEYALQMPFESHVVFNPRIGEVDRARLLQQFRRWWLAICLRVRSQQEDGAASDAMTWSGDHLEREKNALETLNAALRIPCLSPDVGSSASIFASLVTEGTWCPAESAVNLLLRVAAQLMALPDNGLERLRSQSLAMVAELEAQQR